MTNANLSLPKWFLIVAAIALLWNLVGVAAYIGQVTISDEAMAALPEAQQELYESTPSWATGAFAIAVFSGLFGCVALLLKKSVAGPLFLVSLIGVAVQAINTFFLSNAIEVVGPAAAAIPTTVFVVSVALFLLARRAKREGWIG